MYFPFPFEIISRFRKNNKLKAVGEISSLSEQRFEIFKNKTDFSVLASVIEELAGNLESKTKNLGTTALLL